MESEPKLLSAAQLVAMRDAMLGQMQFARNYTLTLLEGVPDALWTVAPPGLPTHFSWQIGHLAVAQYGLMLFRQRGRAEVDLELMPSALRKRYARASTPALDGAEPHSREEMMAILDRIHREAMDCVQQLSPEVLAEPTEMPYAAYPIKLGALLFCPLHESIHAGQIGLLRRAHGLPPVR